MKLHLTFLFLAFGLSFSYAQKKPDLKDLPSKISSEEESRFYIKGYLDYGLASPNSFKGVSNLTANSVFKTTQKGWGQGLKVGIGGAYIINDFVNLGLDIDYFLSPKIESSASIGSAQVSTIFNGQIVAFTPNITFKAIQNADFYPYSRVGITVAMPFGMTNTVNTVSGSTAVKSINTFKSSPALGYIAALGVRKSLSPGLKLFMELQANNLTIQPKSSSITTYLVNGEDKLPQLTVAQKETVYTDSPNTTANANSPTQSTKTPFLVSRVCLQLGFTFRF
jgi:hypothetical protein